MAISKQNTKAPEKVAEKPSKKVLTDEVKAKMLQAVKNGKTDAVQTALENYEVSKKEVSEILANA